MYCVLFLIHIDVKNKKKVEGSLIKKKIPLFSRQCFCQYYKTYLTKVGSAEIERINFSTSVRCFQISAKIAQLVVSQL